MRKFWKNYFYKIFVLFFVCVLSFSFLGNAFADLYLNILAVNGTDETKDKDIRFSLPKELTSDNILDTDRLELDYDVNEGAYYVYGKITLAPKETKTFKILIADLWQIEESEILKIKSQIENSLAQIAETQYYEIGKIKQQSLLQRLNFLIQEQVKYADNIEKRIDSYRVYSDELKEIRDNALSIKFWRSKPPDIREADIFYYVIELENKSSEQTQISKKKNYLPKEVKPEHFVDLQDFDIRYDPAKGMSYLIKEEELQPAETKTYSIGIIDVWNIKDVRIENLKNRARDSYKFIAPTKYVENANFLMSNIKKNFDTIEKTQAREQDINEHISTYRMNVIRLAVARKDVESLEELLEVIREELKRSKIENVLRKVRGLRTLADIAKSILKKPADKLAWNIIIIILGFVAVITVINFAIWGNRSKNITDEKPDEKEEGK